MNAAEQKRWLQDLLVDEVTQGLCGAQLAELERLLAEDASAVDEQEAFMRAASAAELAFAAEAIPAANDAAGQSLKGEALPESLEASLEELVSRLESGEIPSIQAGAESAPVPPLLKFPDPATSPRDAISEPPAPRSTTVEPSGRGPSASVAWWLAAAACVLAVSAWLPRFSSTGPEQTVAQQSTSGALESAQPIPPTAPEAYSTVLTMSGTEDAAAEEATGQLLWDSERQEGVMLIRGLAENDVSLSQYQLWIFDATRDERHPIDGGVFDISSSAPRLEDGSVVVPIDARLTVAEPTLFAITIERPGGVVVSERERIVMVASVS